MKSLCKRSRRHKPRYHRKESRSQHQFRLTAFVHSHKTTGPSGQSITLYCARKVGPQCCPMPDRRIGKIKPLFSPAPPQPPARRPRAARRDTMLGAKAPGSPLLRDNLIAQHTVRRIVHGPDRAAGHSPAEAVRTHSRPYCLRAAYHRHCPWYRGHGAFSFPVEGDTQPYRIMTRVATSASMKTVRSIGGDDECHLCLPNRVKWSTQRPAREGQAVARSLPGKPTPKLPVVSLPLLAPVVPQ